MEVAAGPLLGPLAGLGAVRSSGGVVASEVMLPRGGSLGKVGESPNAVSAAPSVPASLVAMVAGMKDALNARLEGLGGLAEASCQVRALSGAWYDTGSSPRGWVRCPLRTHGQALSLFLSETVSICRG